MKFLVKDMCHEAGLKGNFTNHSLRATGASMLFESGCSEALIKKRTGHKSLEALRKYERTTVDQIDAVSKVLSSSAPVLYKDVFESSRKSKQSESKEVHIDEVETTRQSQEDEQDAKDAKISDGEEVRSKVSLDSGVHGAIDAQEDAKDVRISDGMDVRSSNSGVHGAQDVVPNYKQFPIFQNCVFNNCSFSSPFSSVRETSQVPPSCDIPWSPEVDDYDAPFGDDLNVFSFYSDD